MATEVKPERAYAYAELLEILSFMDEEYVNKIPKKLMTIFRENALDTYENHIDISIPLEEQKLSKKTSALIAMLTVQYWCESQEEKEKLMEIFEENERKYQEELREKYNPNNIFNNNDNKDNNNENENNLSTESVEEQITNNEEKNENSELPMDYNVFPWYKKVFTKVKLFLYNVYKNIKNIKNPT